MLFKDFLTPAIALLGLGFGLWQYWRTSKREFEKPLREAQLQLYREATATAAILATEPRGSTKWKQALADFHRLYFGPLAMLEDFKHDVGANELTVEEAMIVFKSVLDQAGQDKKLRNLSLALAHTCRESLGRSWGVRMSALEGNKDYLPIAVAERDKIKKTKFNRAAAVAHKAG